MGYDCEAAINFSIDAVASQKLDANKKAILAKTLWRYGGIRSVELEKRGLRYVRYVYNFSIYVKSEKSPKGWIMVPINLKVC